MQESIEPTSGHYDAAGFGSNPVIAVLAGHTAFTGVLSGGARNWAGVLVALKATATAGFTQEYADDQR